MLGKSPNQSHPQTNLFRPLLSSFINLSDPLIVLGSKIEWQSIEDSVSGLYARNGAPSKPVRLMAGLLMLKQMFNKSDEVIVQEWKQNPYYQYFTGGIYFEWEWPCDPSELVHFRNRIGQQGVQKIFEISQELHADKIDQAEELIVDTTVQEKNISYPTDTKLTLKIIEKSLKFAKRQSLKLKQTYGKELKELKVSLRFAHHPKRKNQARKAFRRLKTIAGRIVRDTAQKAEHKGINSYSALKGLFEKVLDQKRNSKNKIYSLHETQVACIAKGKTHKPYEFGSKISLAMIPGANIILGVSHFLGNPHDSTTLQPTLQAISKLPQGIKYVIVDRGYRGNKKIGNMEVVLPNPKADLNKPIAFRQQKSTQCKRRAAIEPVISHIKHDCRMLKNYLKATKGDIFNAIMAAAAFNLRLKLNEIKDLTPFWLKFSRAALQRIINMSIHKVIPQLNSTF